MTYGEAINIIYRSVIIDVATREQTSEALMLMTKAVEKQIPKKPTMKADSGFAYEVAMTLVCPHCEKPVINYWNKSVNPPHCMMCGQALDWSGRERRDNNGR